MLMTLVFGYVCGAVAFGLRDLEDNERVGFAAARGLLWPIGVLFIALVWSVGLDALELRIARWRSSQQRKAVRR